MRSSTARGVLIDAPDRVYEAHMRELIARAASGGDMNDATDAEICWVMKDLSMVTPLNGDGFYLYYTCFCRAFPEDAAKLFDGLAWTPRESWPGRGNELRE